MKPFPFGLIQDEQSLIGKVEEFCRVVTSIPFDPSLDFATRLTWQQKLIREYADEQILKQREASYVHLVDLCHREQQRAKRIDGSNATKEKARKERQWTIPIYEATYQRLLATGKYKKIGAKKLFNQAWETEARDHPRRADLSETNAEHFLKDMRSDALNRVRA